MSLKLCRLVIGVSYTAFGYLYIHASGYTGRTDGIAAV
jgi:hypothetical protein